MYLCRQAFTFQHNCTTATTGILLLQSAFCVRRRNMMHSSLSPNTTKTGCTRSNLNPHFIQFNNSMQKKTSKVLLLGLENPDDGNKSFSCFVHDRDWKVKHYCHPMVIIHLPLAHFPPTFLTHSPPVDEPFTPYV